MSVDARTLHCVVCAKSIVIVSRTNTHPDCPEFIKAPPGTWMGFIRGDHSPEMIVFCSNACCDTFFRNAKE